MRSLSVPFVANSSVTQCSGRPVATSIHDVKLSSTFATILTRPTAFAWLCTMIACLPSTVGDVADDEVVASRARRPGARACTSCRSPGVTSGAPTGSCGRRIRPDPCRGRPGLPRAAVGDRPERSAMSKLRGKRVEPSASGARIASPTGAYDRRPRDEVGFVVDGNEATGPRRHPLRRATPATACSSPAASSRRPPRRPATTSRRSRTSPPRSARPPAACSASRASSSTSRRRRSTRPATRPTCSSR